MYTGLCPLGSVELRWVWFVVLVFNVSVVVLLLQPFMTKCKSHQLSVMWTCWTLALVLVSHLPPCEMNVDMFSTMT